MVSMTPVPAQKFSLVFNCEPKRLACMLKRYFMKRHWPDMLATKRLVEAALGVNHESITAVGKECKWVDPFWNLRQTSSEALVDPRKGIILPEWRSMKESSTNDFLQPFINSTKEHIDCTKAKLRLKCILLGKVVRDVCLLWLKILHETGK